MITWDEKKRKANLEKHGLDFADASLVYDSPLKITIDSPRDGETRKLDMAMVEIAGTVLVLVYVQRGQDVRAISFRRASRKERRFYEQAKG
ncbi:MAG: BrnT family toxin [Acidobacteriota bacterium]|nr:BrnT family toxin [Acidobacteriota bacterium]